MRMPKGRLARVARVATRNESLIAVSSSGDRLSTDGFLASHPCPPEDAHRSSPLSPDEAPPCHDRARTGRRFLAAGGFASRVPPGRSGKVLLPKGGARCFASARSALISRAK